MRSPFSSRLLALFAALSLALTTNLALPAQAGEPDQVRTYDGSSSEKAAASCYEIKENNPQAESGTYWLYTPAMTAPAQFYCDQETEGGGWVMIGRGREGWTDTYQGRGDPNLLHLSPTGPEAFAPVQLNSATVDALLNDQAPSQLEDGIRFHRATTAAGDQWQEVYAHRGQVQDWSWSLDSYANWESVRYDNGPDSAWTKTYEKSVGRLGQHGETVNTIIFAARASQNWKLGFAYGPGQRGSTEEGSYIYTADENEGYPLPFTQVFLRPKITQADLALSLIADEGLPASNQAALPNNFSEPLTWRTSQETGTGKTGEMNTFVQAITQSGNYVYTAGDFKYIENPGTGEKIEQSFIAAYDVNTGQPLASFTPSFNEQIKALATLPDGSIVAGGDFSEVNGQQVSKLVVLDPLTGQIKENYDWTLSNRNASGLVKVHSLAVKDDYLYVAGSFTHVQGNNSQTAAYAKNAARYRLSDGSVDWKWRPVFNGTVNGIDPSSEQGTVYAAGYFSSVNGQDAFRLAALTGDTAARSAQWDWKGSYTKARNSAWNYQFDVQAALDSIWTGGAEHLIAQYRSSDFSRISSSITRDGGDFQDLSYKNGIIYGACHCGDGLYEGAEMYLTAWDELTNLHQIRLIGAWDASTGAFLPDFNPQLKGIHGHGIWESFTDSTGVLWVGGDIAYSIGANGPQKTVGFARFAPRKVTPAPAPLNLRVEQVDGKDQLSWEGPEQEGISYQIFRDDRPIASTSTRSYSSDHVTGARYFVRTIDDAANYSQTTPVATSSTG